MHLLLFYEMSKPAPVAAGLNNYLEFNPEFVADISQEFMQVMEVQ